MKGIILAGGNGYRLGPITRVTNKHLLPVFDKPGIYYPLSVLLNIGIKEILIISTPEAIPSFESLLGNGLNLGISIQYAVQQKPRGIAEAFIIGESFISGESSCLILGDNVICGEGLNDILRYTNIVDGADVFAYPVNNPCQYGVIELDKSGSVLSIEEKPINPRSNLAIPGIYFYDSNVVNYAKELTPTTRGEIEIWQINERYMRNGKLRAHMLSKDTVWFDTGVPKNLLRAAEYIERTQRAEGKYIACIEEIAWNMGYRDSTRLKEVSEQYKVSEYGQYLLTLVE